MAEEGIVAAYVRVSSASQSSAMQRDAIDRASTARGEKVVRWYTDTATGGTMHRSDLDELRRCAREGRIRKLYVYRLDRLTRTGIRDTLDLVQELKRHGCELASVADGFDPSGPAAEIVLAVMAWGAQIERLAINERISAARVRVEAKGGAWGRPPRLSKAECDRVIAYHAKGQSARKISVALKIPRATVARAIARYTADVRRVAQKVAPKTTRPGASKTRGKRGPVR